MNRELRFRLLDHPFYQSWTAGTVTTEQLSRYAKAYAGFIERMPTYWQRIVEGLNVQEDARPIIDDETDHISQWQTWAEKLPVSQDAPVLTELLDGLERMEPSELLGAIHAFEIQQPEVAHTKKEGLMAHYGFAAEDLTYFDEHMHEAEHISFGENIKEKYADETAFQAGFEQGAQLVYASLDEFVEPNC